ncbi:MAG: S41 family peptidase [Treponemataceae bacterium]|nr:S41 family peptidase [Treponemataceae bacterium]
MNSSEKKSFLIKFCVVLFALMFGCYAVFTPSVYAQQQGTDQKQIKSSVYMQLINSIFGFVMQNYVDEVDPQELYEGALKGMLESLDDPYSQYLDASTMRSFSDTTTGEFGGVGLSITKPVASTPEKPAYVEVASPIEGGPGYKAGVLAGDYIIAIGDTATPDITMDEVLGMLRGKVGETVHVTIKRGKSMVFDLDLVREIIEVPTVKFTTIPSNGKKIGYIKIIEFTPLTPEKVQEALDSFGKTYDGLIIDLRNNPGGLITSVRDVADKFIDEGTIVSTKNRNGEIDSLFSASPANTTMPKNIPIIVLINHGSASASEILSGALKDHKLAYLMGERSYGKGSVQQLIPLYNNDGVKITMARYYTPSDVNIDKIGIPPDREVKLISLTEDEEKEYVNIVNDDAIAKYVEAHPNLSDSGINAAAKELCVKYPMNEKFMRRLVRLEVYRHKEPFLYDLDFDDQLGAALNVFSKENFNELLNSTLTLKQLQDAAKLEVEKEDSGKKTSR